MATATVEFAVDADTHGFFECADAHARAVAKSRATRELHAEVISTYGKRFAQTNSLYYRHHATPEEVEAALVLEHEQLVAESAAKLEATRAKLRQHREALDAVAAAYDQLTVAAHALTKAERRDADGAPSAPDIHALGLAQTTSVEDASGHRHRPCYAGLTHTTAALKRALLDLHRDCPAGWAKRGCKGSLTKYLRGRGVWRELVRRSRADPAAVERLLGFVAE